MKRFILIIFIVGGLTGAGCKKKNTSSKIMDGLPVNTLETVVPSKAAQEWFLLNQDLGRNLVNFLYRMQSYLIPTFPELTPQGGPSYGFALTDSHYGNATMTLQFMANGAPVDPGLAVSSMTVNQIVVTSLSGTSPDFTYLQSAPIALTIQTAGNLSSLKTLVGAMTFTGIGSGYSLVFTDATILLPGIACSTEGLIAGNVVGSGSGPTGPTSIFLTFDVQHNANGTITWEGNQGEIHMNTTGNGVVLTPQTRFPIN